MFEKIIFNVIAIALFTITFLKLIKKNDTAYIYLLLIEFIGIAINFTELLVATSFHASIKILMYLLSIAIPLLLFIIEKTLKIDLSELFRIVAVYILNKLGKTDTAKTILNKFLAKNPNSYISHKLLAQIYMKEENYEAAISEYIKVTDLKSQDMDSYYQLSIAFNKNNQNEKAIIILQDILKQMPENEKATYLLGDIYFEQQMYKEAVSVYMAALRYHPSSFELYYNVGMAYTMINDFQRAKEFYEKAAEINTLSYNAKLNLGQIALIYGDLDEAENYFRQSLKQEDLEAGSYYYLSQIAILKGDEDRARNYMNVAVQLDPRAYMQMKKDPIFEPIKKEVMPPSEQLETKEIKKVLTKKEKKVNSHLSKTCILIENLNSDDIQKFNKKKENQIENEGKQKE